MLELPIRALLYSGRGHSKLDMPQLSSKLQCACGKLSFNELYLHFRMDRAEWRPVRCVCGRKVQGNNRIGRVHGLRDREVFYSRKAISKLDMHPLSVKLHLACGELSFDELQHLQLRLLWTCWRPLHSVCGRKVQGVDRISSVHGLRGRDIFYRNWCSPVHQLWSRDLFDSSKGLIKHDMQ